MNKTAKTVMKGTLYLLIVLENKIKKSLSGIPKISFLKRKYNLNPVRLSLKVQLFSFVVNSTNQFV